MHPTDWLPSPDGLYDSGFTLHDTNFLSGPSMAAIRPQNGLITVILGEASRGFPDEEYVHLGTLVRNPSLINTAQTEYWYRQTGAEIRTITAWAPFVEAVNQVYLGFDAHQSLYETTTETVPSRNAAYADWYADQAIAWYRKNRSDQAGDPQPDGTPDKDAARPFDKRVEETTQHLNEFITEYKAQGLHRCDIHNLWLRLDTDFVILILLEVFLPYTVARTALEQRDLYIHYYPEQCWQAIDATLTQWRDRVAHGESPFPFHNLTPPKLFNFFEIEWARLTCNTMGLLCKAVLSTFHEADLVRSLPALYYNLNPHTATQWFASPHHVQQYPVLLLSQDTPQCKIIEPTRDKQGLHELAQVIWHKYKQCPLYTDLTAWRLTTRDIETYTRRDILAMALQLWTFLTRIEHL